MKNLKFTPSFIETIKAGLLLFALILALVFFLFNLLFYSIALIVVISAFIAYDFLKNKFKKRRRL